MGDAQEQGMHKKHTVRLMELEHRTCDAASTSSRTAARRPGEPDSYSGWMWTGRADRQVAEAYRCRTRTVGKVRRRCALEGFEQALNGKQSGSPLAPKLLRGE